MIPKDKYDKESVALLRSASDEEVVEIAEQLLEWLQDSNWPVFQGIIKRLSTLCRELEGPITRILEGNDSVWKLNIIEHLIPSFSHKNQKVYSKTLMMLLKRNDESDLLEGVTTIAEMQLNNANRGELHPARKT